MRLRFFAMIMLAVSLPPAVAGARGPLLETLDGKPFDAAHLPANTLLMFWTPDCTFCHQEMAEIGRDGDADFLARLVLVALLPRQAVDARKFGLPAAAVSLASRAAPADVMEYFGNPGGLMPFAIVTGVDGAVCRRLTGKTDLAGMQAAIAACRTAVTR